MTLAFPRLVVVTASIALLAIFASACAPAYVVGKGLQNLAPAPTEQLNELHKAVYREDVKKVREMLHAGADVQARTSFARTAIVIAVETGNVQITELLIRHGADPKSTRPYDRRGHSLLQVAIEENWPEMVTYLLAKGAYLRPEPEGDLTFALFRRRAILNMQYKGSTLELHSERSLNIVRTLLGVGMSLPTKSRLDQLTWAEDTDLWRVLASYQK